MYKIIKLFLQTLSIVLLLRYKSSIDKRFSSLNQIQKHALLKFSEFL